MSSPIKPMLTVVAFQLAAALESYQSDFDDMVQSWHDPQRYAAVNRRLEDIRMYRGALPQLSADMVEVLIAHVELVHALWDATLRPSQAAAAKIQRLREPLHRKVECMRSKCLRLCSHA